MKRKYNLVCRKTVSVVRRIDVIIPLELNYPLFNPTNSIIDGNIIAISKTVVNTSTALDGRIYRYIFHYHEGVRCQGFEVQNETLTRAYLL
jgi:hypothetical protein